MAIRRFSKRGSLQLSINAIVVLVLALTMLGVGIAFTKNMLGNLGDKISVPEPPVKATRGEPIQLPSETIVGEVGKDIEFTVSVFNKLQYDFIGYSSKCKYREDGEWIEDETQAPYGLSQSILPGSAGNYKFTMDGPNEIKAYTCTLTFCYTGNDDSNEDNGDECSNVDIADKIGSKQIIIKFQ